MRKIVSVLMLVFALVLAGCSGGLEGMTSLDTTNDDYKIDNLNAQITSLQTQISNLQTQLDALSNTTGDNVVVIDQDTINQIFYQITVLRGQVADLKVELDALKTQVNTDNVTINDRLTVLEGDVAVLKVSVKTINTQIENLWTAINNLDCGEGGGRPEGGPAYVFSGEGVPGDDLDARQGDFYISTTPTHDGRGFGYIIYLYTDELGWVEFGLIKVGSGDAVDPPEPSSVERF